jgi:hypothetical protein
MDVNIQSLRDRLRNRDNTITARELLYVLEKAEEAEQWAELRTDPAVVHLNMLRGGIAKPSLRNMLHLEGHDALTKWDRIDRQWIFAARVFRTGQECPSDVAGVIAADNEETARELIWGRIKASVPSATGANISVHRDTGAPILIVDGDAVAVLGEN